MLKWYNGTDVKPFMQALTKMRERYKEITGGMVSDVAWGWISANIGWDETVA